MLSPEQRLWSRWVNSRYMIKTPQIEKLYGAVEHMLLVKTTGAMVLGTPRIGKTYALHYICIALQELLGNVPYVEIDVRNETRYSDEKFCQMILERTGHILASAGRAADKRFRLSERLFELASHSEFRTIILVLDEAQFLSDSHLQWLLNITNEVERLGASALCILVGQKQELDARKAALQAGGFRQLLGRFMVERHEMHGITSEEELSSCLEQYSLMLYPFDADFPLFQRLLSGTAHGVWKPEQDAAFIWQLFDEEWAKAGNTHALEIPMKWFCAYVHEYVFACLSSVQLSAMDLHRVAMRRSNFRGFAEALMNEMK